MTLLLTQTAAVHALDGARAELAGAVRHESRYAMVTPGQWSSFDGPRSRFHDPEAFLDEVDQYVVLISGYLGRPAWLDRYGGRGKIEFVHEPDGYCHVEGGYYHFEAPVLRVYLNGTFRNDRAPLAHEITHLILPDYSSLSLREGLASEMQDRFGRNTALYNLGADVHALSAGILPGASRQIVESIGRQGIAAVAFTDDEEVRAAFYLLSHSFSRYLIDRFGREAFLRLYESGNLAADYRAVTDRDLEALRGDWQEFISLRGTTDRHVAATDDEREPVAGAAPEGRQETGSHTEPL